MRSPSRAPRPAEAHRLPRSRATPPPPAAKGSPFYSASSNNEKLRVNEGPEALEKMVGAEYVVDTALSSPPHLWVIRYQWRADATQASLLKLFYMIHGVVYPSPTPLLLVESRLSKASHHLHRAFDSTRRAFDLARRAGADEAEELPPVSNGNGMGFIPPSLLPPPPPPAR